MKNVFHLNIYFGYLSTKKFSDVNNRNILKFCFTTMTTTQNIVFSGLTVLESL